MRAFALLSLGGLILIHAAAAQDAQKCAGLTSVTPTLVPGSTTMVRSARLNGASAAQGNAAAVPEHCEVQGSMNERTGMFSQTYAIKFHLRMPTAWNGAVLLRRRRWDQRQRRGRNRQFAGTATLQCSGAGLRGGFSGFGT